MGCKEFVDWTRLAVSKVKLTCEKTQNAAGSSRRRRHALIYSLFDLKLHKIKANQHFRLKKYIQKERFAKV